MTGKAALVTGASRGAGKGIARALARAGYHVYVTGRSTDPTASPVGGTVAETVAEIVAKGDAATGIVCDHADDAQVKAAFDRIAAEQGRLDILVNNAAFLPEEATADRPFWVKPLAMADLITVGLRSHYVASWHAAQMMVPAGRGLIVQTGHYAAVSYFLGPVNGAQKAGADKMTADMARELRPHGVSALSIWMGALRTERSAGYFAALPPEGKAAALAASETPDLTGLVIAALAHDPGLPALSGQALIGAELANRYGIVDLDGAIPVSHRFALGSPPELHPSLRPTS